MIERILKSKCLALAEKFQVITITGPRQSGKTTLVKDAFSNLPYISLEAPDVRQVALSDPRGFLSNYPKGVILDEVQNAPDLLSYIQGIVDENRDAKFILTGSSNFLLMEKVNQTLAGRTALLNLLPFSFQELELYEASMDTYEELIYKGQYPRVYDRDLDPLDFYPAYIQTYVEKDVRLVKNIGDINAFIRFVQICAGRVGQLINYASFANDAGVSPNTAKAWLSILETSYILYRLQPFHRNFNKRLVKSPKLYFYDTGVACSLLGIRNPEQVGLHYLRGALFENLILNEFTKKNLNRGENRKLYFWQDRQRKEIDCLLTEGETFIPIEIKSGKTVDRSYFDNLKYFQSLAGTQDDRGYVVFGGEGSLKTSDGLLVGWRELNNIDF